MIRIQSYAIVVCCCCSVTPASLAKPGRHLQTLAGWAALYGPIFKWGLAGMNILVITDPEEMSKLVSREASPPKAVKSYPLSKVPAWPQILCTV